MLRHWSEFQEYYQEDIDYTIPSSVMTNQIIENPHNFSLYFYHTFEPDELPDEFSDKPFENKLPDEFSDKPFENQVPDESLEFQYPNEPFQYQGEPQNEYSECQYPNEPFQYQGEPQNEYSECQYQNESYQFQGQPQIESMEEKPNESMERIREIPNYQLAKLSDLYKEKRQIEQYLIFQNPFPDLLYKRADILALPQPEIIIEEPEVQDFSD